ncbi:MAG: hypothetical protein ACTSRD_12950, partial [Promethearchaeota archaeon]
EQETTEHLENSYQENVPNFWEMEEAEHIYVPVEDGAIRVIHIKPDKPLNKRPIVLLPGFAVPPVTFQDFYAVLHDNYEMYYLETREKSSSRIRRFARMSVPKSAMDVGIALKFLGLDKRDFILAGTCWGSSIILQGLIDKTIDAPTIITQDPMYRFTFNKFMLNWIIPLMPPVLIFALKPIFKKARVGKMKEEYQMKRVQATIDDAVPWKWKNSAVHSRKFLLYGNLHKVEKEVLVVNAIHDYLHDPVNYPNIAQEIPKGRYFQLKGVENKREYILGLICREFSKVSKGEIPDSMKQFEVEIPR